MKKTEESKPKRKRSCFRIPDELILEVAKDRHLEGKSTKEIAKEHGISLTTVNRILCKFAAENDKSALLMGKRTTDSLSEDNKALRKEILDLKKQLYHEKMRADFYDTMVDVAEEMLGIEIRKKAVTGQSKDCTKESQDTL